MLGFIGDTRLESLGYCVNVQRGLWRTVTVIYRGRPIVATTGCLLLRLDASRSSSNCRSRPAGPRMGCQPTAYLSPSPIHADSLVQPTVSQCLLERPCGDSLVQPTVNVSWRVHAVLLQRFVHSFNCHSCHACVTDSSVWFLAFDCSNNIESMFISLQLSGLCVRAYLTALTTVHILDK